MDVDTATVNLDVELTLPLLPKLQLHGFENSMLLDSTGYDSRMDVDTATVTLDVELTLPLLPKLQMYGFENSMLLCTE